MSVLFLLISLRVLECVCTCTASIWTFFSLENQILNICKSLVDGEPVGVMQFVTDGCEPCCDYAEDRFMENNQ